jgi:PAS domain S-box-containing protein
VSSGLRSRSQPVVSTPQSPLPAPADDRLGAAAPIPSAGVLIADADQRVRHVEGDVFADRAVGADSWIGLRLDEALPRHARPILIPRYAAALAGEPQAFEYRSQDGARAYWVQMTPIRDRAGVIDAVVSVMQDITEQLRVTSELARSEARLHEAERMVGVGSWELAVRTGEITFSPGFARLLGMTDGQRLDADSHFQMVHPDDRDRVARVGADSVRAGATVCEYRVIRPDGDIRTLSLHAELVPREPNQPLYMRGAVLDVTHQRETERERLAAELLFRQGFDGAPIGMALTDPVDGRYLQVNDSLCRLLGRSREDLLGRTFDSVTHVDDQAKVHQARAGLLSDTLATSFQTEKRYLRADGTIAWGMLHLTPVRRSDGSVEAFHSQIVDITERKEREARLVHDVGDAVWLGRIRDALDEDRLVLYAQPIVDLVTGETVQHELLLRMRDEGGCIVPPGDFLPVAERYGLISEIDRWVIRQAVEIAAGGTATEFNLSGRSIADPTIIHELRTAISETGADPSLLVVEVTETAFVGQIEAGRAFAHSVKELGCRLALDDFGTGFSSLSYLKHLPADFLKIDIDFVRELASSETDARVIRGIVGLAREFDQTTIAEGVEDEATLLLLKELGVDQAQGYLLGTPAPRTGAAASLDAVRSPPAASGADPVAIVEAAFEAFARRDLPAMLSFCRPDIVLRTIATSHLSNRGAPYRGIEGVRAYLSDVATVWDELTLTPLSFRQAQGSVIGFGRADGRRGAERVVASILWVVRVHEDQIASIEVFQAVDGGASLSPSQLDRLTRPGAGARHPLTKDATR